MMKTLTLKKTRITPRPGDKSARISRLTFKWNTFWLSERLEISAIYSKKLGRKRKRSVSPRKKTIAS